MKHTVELHFNFFITNSFLLYIRCSLNGSIIANFNDLLFLYYEKEIFLTLHICS